MTEVGHPPRDRVPGGCRSSLKRYGDHHVQQRIPRRLRLRKASLSAGFGSLEILGFRLDAPLLQCSNRISSFDWFGSSICYSGPQKGASISGQHWKLGESPLGLAPDVLTKPATVTKNARRNDQCLLGAVRRKATMKKRLASLEQRGTERMAHQSVK